MSIEYHIVWVDDSPDWVDSVIEEINEHLSDHGFMPKIERLENGSALQERCASVALDLIIVDYNLPDKRNGDLLISELRDRGIFKEVVFYSQQGTTKKIIGATDGVFHADRSGAVDVIKRVIDLTVHKLRDLDVVRGLIISTTIDLEVKLEEIMVLAFGDSGGLFRAKVLDKQIFDFQKKSNFLQSHLNDLIISEVVDARKRQLEKVCATHKDFAKDVVDQRNILAHVKKAITVDGRTVLKGINKSTKEIEFTEAWLRTTRLALSKHMDNLLSIEQLLSH